VTGLLGRRRRRADLTARLQALAAAGAALGPHVSAQAGDEVGRLLDRAGQRAAIAPDRTVVALAGSTGSGKSSLFNAITGIDLAVTGVRRPTTAHPLACTWGQEGSQALLDWLQIPPARRVARESELGPAPGAMRGLVLLDLPDHDSMVTEHRAEVDRLVGLVDLLVWVVDPQKYADALLHEQYLRRLTAHGAVVVVVLNQVDRLTPQQQRECLDDLRGLLQRDGLADVPVLAVSATRGDGMQAVQQVLQRAVRSRQTSAERLAADVTALALRLADEAGLSDALPEQGTGRTDAGGAAGEQQLLAEVAAAVGVPALTEVVRRGARRRAQDAVGWPVARLARRVRAGPGEQQTGPVVALAVQDATPVVHARVDLAVRAFVEQATAAVPQAWARRVHDDVRSAGADLATRTSARVVEVAAAPVPAPWWWPVWSVAQTVAALVAGVGLVWLLSLAVLGLGVPSPPSAPTVGGWPWPGVLLLGGVATSLVLSLLVQAVPGRWARTAAGRAEQQMTAVVHDELRAGVLPPVQATVQARDDAVQALRLAVG
jgi:GTP-binding protein EngB required for normal cell division